eukprot:s243_g21.t1
MPRRPRQYLHGCFLLRWLVRLCLVLLVSCELHQLSLVQGIGCRVQNVAKCQVTERCRQQRQVSGQSEADAKAQAMRLTVSFKKAQSAEKLIEILDKAVGGPILNFFHVSAAYHKLAKLKRRGLQQTDWDNPVLLRLHGRVEDMIQQGQFDAQASANVLWSIAQLSDRFSIPTQLLAALVNFLPTKAKGMIPQALSNCLWACAKLKDVAPDVLEVVPAIVTYIPNKAQSMKPQELSNSLWASARLEDVAPHALEAVPAICAQIPEKAKDMVAQDLANCLLASAQLEDLAPDVLKVVLAIVAEIPAKVKGMNPQDLCSLQAFFLLKEPVPEVECLIRSAAARLNALLPRFPGNGFNLPVPAVVWSCAKAGVYHSELLVSVAQGFGSQTKLHRLKDFGLCALSWSYQVLDQEDDFTGFRKQLRSETERRKLSEADVQSSKHGYLKWNRSDQRLLQPHRPGPRWSHRPLAAPVWYLQLLLGPSVEPAKRQPRPFSRCLCMIWLLPLWFLWRMVSYEPHQLPFVQGNPWGVQSAVKGQVTERCRPRCQAVSRKQKAKAKKLRSQLNRVESAKELIEILDEALDGPIFNRSKPSVAYSMLVHLSKKKGLMPKDWDSPVISRLHDRFEALARQGQLSAKTSAQVLRSCAHLSHKFHVPTPLLVALVKSLRGKMRSISPKQACNILEACEEFKEPALGHLLLDDFKQICDLLNGWSQFAQLRDVPPEVLEMVPRIASKIPQRARTAQECISGLQACVQFKDLVPPVLDVVPKIATQIPKKALTVEVLFSGLKACVQFKDLVPAVLRVVPGIAGQISKKADTSEELVRGLKACVQLKDLVPPVLDVVPDIAAQISKKALTAKVLVSGLKACVQFKDLVPAVLDVVPDMAAQIPKKESTAEDLASSLEIVAQLKDVAPAVLDSVPDIAAQIPKKASTAEEFASGLQACVRFKDLVPPVLDVVPDIAAQIPKKALTAEVLVSGLQACVQLKDLVPAVLDVVPDIVAQIPKKESTAEDFASSLEIVAQLKDVAPAVLDSVPDIAAQIPETSKSWIPGPLRDCLAALGQLQDRVPNAVLAPALVAEGSPMKRMSLQSLATMARAFQLLQHDFLRCASAHLSSVVRKVRPQKFDAVVKVVSSCTQARVYPGELLQSVAQHLGSPAKLASMTGFGLVALLRSYEDLDVHDDFTEFRGLLLMRSAPSAASSSLLPSSSTLMARRGVRSGPYNGAAKVQGAPAAKNGTAKAKAAGKLPATAMAELEKIQDFIDTWGLDPPDTKRYLAKLPPQQRRWLLETYDGSEPLEDFLRDGPSNETSPAPAVATAVAAGPREEPGFDFWRPPLGDLSSEEGEGGIAPPAEVPAPAPVFAPPPRRRVNESPLTFTFGRPRMHCQHRWKWLDGTTVLKECHCVSRMRCLKLANAYAHSLPNPSFEKNNRDLG